MKETNEVKIDDPVIKVQIQHNPRRLIDGYRKRYYLLNLKKSKVIEVNRLMKEMDEKTTPIRNKYNNLRDKETQAIEKPYLKAVKKLGVDF